jgi:ABC-2 type transport system ATP-binding protein
VYALEINHVSKVYNNKFKALDDVDFQLNQGDFVGLLGINGAGKTSLISSIAGINSFNGQIKILGQDVLSSLVAAKKQLGVVPQELAFDPFLTVRQTLTFQSGLYGVKNNQAWIDELVGRMHLVDKMDANTRSLSGGMKRRLMVAQALVHKPPLIILDEPTVGVDVEIRKNLWEFIQELHTQGHTILLTTHYLEEVEKLCNQIIMIDKGKIIAKSSKDELISRANGLPIFFEVETNSGLFSDSLNNLIVNKELNKYTLRLTNSEEIMLVLAQLQQDGIKVENMNISRPKLEDIFLKYLGR